MRTWHFCALALGLLLIPTGWVTAQEPKEILEKAVKAHGGLEKINKFKALQSKAKGKIELMGGLEFTQEVSVLVPDKFKEVVHVMVNGQQVDVTTVYDGKQGWVSAGGVTKPLEGNILDAVKDAIETMGLARLAFVGGKDYELGPLGETKVNNRPAVGVKVSRKGGKQVNLFFDKETGLLGKIEHRTKDAMTGQEVNEERIILEYQDVEGMKTAKKAVVNREGMKYVEVEVTDVKLLESLDASEFAKP
jgi:hypothetical protein